MEDILINWSPPGNRVTMVENNAVQELHRTGAGRGLVGNVYLGRVVQVLPGMQSASSTSGWSAAAFLHVADLPAARAGGNGRHNHNADTPTPSERLVFEGQALLVQVIRTPSAPRAPACPARSASPAACWCGTSTSASARRSARLRRASCCARACRPLVGTAGTEAAASSCAMPRKPPTKTWPATSPAARDLAADPRQGTSAAPPSLLHQDLSLVERVLRDLTTERTNAIRIDSALQYQVLRQFADPSCPRSAAKLEHYRGERPIFDLLQHRHRDCPSAGAQVRAEVGRLAGVRPDRGDDDHRRQHQGLRRRPQL